MPSSACTQATATSALLDALRDAVGAAHVLTTPDELAPYVVDWRGRYRGAVLAVVCPADTAQVAAAVRACAAAGVSVVPQGGNTGLVGAAVPLPGPDGTPPVVIALRRMNRILATDAVGNTITVQAGCVLADVQAAAIAADRYYGVSLGAEGSCQIGGNIATNAGGTGVIKYGSTREQVLGIEVVLPDGRVWNGLRALRKDNAGYALRQLFVGAEGTLGIITAATLRLHPRPRASSTAWLTADTVDHLLQTLAALQTAAGERVATFELLNQAQLRIVQAHIPDVRLPADPQAPYAVLVELTDTHAGADLDELLTDALAPLIERGILRDVAVASSHAQRDAFWRIRHGISEANRSHGMGLSTDVAVPVDKVGTFIDAASEAVRAAHPEAEIVLVAHMGDGNVHFIPMFSFDAWRAMPAPEATADAVRALVHDVAAGLDGTFSAEHGVGFVLAEELVRLRPAIELELMQRIRNAVDTTGRQNPGKVLT